MRKGFFLSVFIGIGLLLSLVGCGGGGGGGGSDSPTAAVANPFAGSYQGVWKAAALNQSGLITMTIGTDGTTTGNVYNYTLNSTGALVGTTANTGVYSGTVTYVGQAASPISGTLVAGANAVTGDFSQTINAQLVSGSFKMNSVVSSSNPYAGTWAGPWVIQSLPQNGSATVVISSNGTLAGTIQNITLGQTGTLTCFVDSFGNYSGKVDYPGQSSTAIAGALGTPVNNTITSSYIQTANAVEYSGVFSFQKY